MNAVDRFLQRLRIRMAAPYVRAGDRLLDLGCYDAAFIEHVRSRVSHAVGIDQVATPVEHANVTILCGKVPGDPRLEPASFDCVTVLAALEHFEDPVAVSHECYQLLKPGGRLIMTVPHPIVDHIVDAFVRMHVAEGMDLEAHHGFDVHATEPMFTAAGFRLVARRTFELGLNHLYVFEKPAGGA